MVTQIPKPESSFGEDYFCVSNRAKHYTKNYLKLLIGKDILVQESPVKKYTIFRFYNIQDICRYDKNLAKYRFGAINKFADISKNGYSTYSIASHRIKFDVLSKIIQEYCSTLNTKIDIVYKDQAAITSFLGNLGVGVLNKVTELICEKRDKDNWPIIRLEIILKTDIEDRNWNFILVNLVFDSDFKTADNYIHQLYKNIDELCSSISEAEQDILQKAIYLDVEAVISGN
jgi:hypothetical protein